MSIRMSSPKKSNMMTLFRGLVLLRIPCLKSWALLTGRSSVVLHGPSPDRRFPKAALIYWSLMRPGHSRSPILHWPFREQPAICCLLGDPQQLPQVTQGTHPQPVDESALGWLSGGEPVLPGELGYFLAQQQVQQATKLLQMLEALDGKEKLTALGTQMLGFGTDIRLAHMLIKAQQLESNTRRFWFSCIFSSVIRKPC